MDDLEGDFIPLPPPMKRLKRNSSAPAKKAAPKPKRASSKPPKRTQAVEVVDLDSSEDFQPEEETPKPAKLEFLNFLATPSPNPPEMPKDDDNDSDEDDYEGVEFGDMPDEAEEDAERMEVDNQDSGPTSKATDAIELSISAPKPKKEEETKKKEKKPKRVSEEPRKRRGSVAEREFALHFHNSQLLGWLGHAIRVRREIEESKWSQALMLSYLPLPLFEELSALSRDDLASLTDDDGSPGPFRDLLTWFHQFVEVVEPLTPPTRKIHTPAPSRAKLAAGAAPKGKGDPSALFLGLKQEKEEGNDQVIRRFMPQLFAHWTRPKVTQAVAFRAFATILNAFDFTYRMIWHLDKLLAPHKFADFELVIPSARYSPKFFSRLAKKHLQEWRKLPQFSGSSGNKAKKAQIETPEDPPLLWFEVYSTREDRFIVVDLFRSLVNQPTNWDVPTSQIVTASLKRSGSSSLSKKSVKSEDDGSPIKRAVSPNAKVAKKKFGTSESAYIYAVGMSGRLSHVSPKYVNSYCEPLAIMGDWQWAQEMLKEWNVLRSKTEGLKDSEDVNPNLEERLQEDEDEAIKLIAQTEPKPKSKAAYHHHPLYVLEDDLLQFEMLRPDHGPPDHQFNGQDVYSRSQVGIIHTADKWIQYGLQVRAGEVAVSSKIKRTGANWDNVTKNWVSEEEAEMSAYFGDWQIEPFVPPIAKDGLVPKNKYGNVYLFKSEMMPIGCMRIQGYPAIDKTAKRIGIDIAPAMTGWTVEGYWSMPKLEGFIICTEHHDTLIDAWLEDNIHRETERKRKQRAQIAQIWISLTKQLMLQKRLDERPQDGSMPLDETEMDVDSEGEEVAPKKRVKATKKAKVGAAATQHVHNLVSAGEGEPRRCDCGFVEQIANRL